MRATLTQAQHGPLRRPHPPASAGAPPWPAPAVTLHALVRNGLLTTERLRNRHGHRVDIWTITDAGRAALQPREVFKVDQPLYMTRGALRYRVLPNGRWAVVADQPTGDDHDDDGSSADSGDYTTDPRKSIDRDYAPNARTRTAVPVLVQPADLDRFTAAARQREHDEKRQQSAQLDSEPVDKRVVRLERVARNHRTNIDSELRLVRHMLSNGRRRHALQRIERLEAGLGQRAA